MKWRKLRGIIIKLILLGAVITIVNTVFTTMSVPITNELAINQFNNSAEGFYEYQYMAKLTNNIHMFYVGFAVLLFFGDIVRGIKKLNKTIKKELRA